MDTTADAELIHRVEALRTAVDRLAPAVGTLEKKQTRTSKWLKSGSLVIAFDLIVTFAGLYFGASLYHVSTQNDDVLKQLQEVTEKNRSYIEDSCNLYGLVLDGYGSAARDRYAAGPQRYDTLISTIQKSADNLNCGIPHKVG